MLNTVEGKKTITCDKCGNKASAPVASANDFFYALGFRINHRARKYKHLCGSCVSISKKSQ